MINIIRDNAMLLKDAARLRLLHRPQANRTAEIDSLIKRLGLINIERIIHKTGIAMIVTRDMVVRVPRDGRNAARCHINMLMLKKLAKTGISRLVPRFLLSGRFNSQRYYCEHRLPGYAIDLPISKMDDLVAKAADFITRFHRETAQNIIMTESYFKRLIARDFDRLSPYLTDEYRIKLARIKDMLRKKLLGKPFKTVWFHGDYNIENTLFDTRTWRLKGVIDWDLSRRGGLPTLDIFYLLMYKNSLLAKKSVIEVLNSRFLKSDFIFSEEEIITKYCHSLKISEDFVTPMLIMFWLNHVTCRYRQQLIDNSPEWLSQNVYSVIDIISEYK